MLLKRAILIGLLAAIPCALVRYLFDPSGWDLAWALEGARAILRGDNPYHAPMPLGIPLYYPMPTLIVLLPFAVFPDRYSSVVFSGGSTVILAYAVLKYRPHAWPLFLSAPFWWAVLWSQWAIVLTAAALLPALLPLALCKPNIGLPLLALRKPSRASLLLCAGLLAVSFLLLPTWIPDWLANTTRYDRGIPMLTWPGMLLPMALLRWRDARARLLVGMSVVPIRFYDPLALWLIPASRAGVLRSSILSWLVYGAYIAAVRPQPPMEWTVIGLYLPCLLMLFYQQIKITMPSPPRPPLPPVMPPPPPPPPLHSAPSPPLPAVPAAPVPPPEPPVDANKKPPS